MSSTPKNASKPDENTSEVPENPKSEDTPRLGVLEEDESEEFESEDWDLVQERRAILSDIGRYLRVPYATLVRSVFGSCPDTSQIRQKLTEDGILRVDPGGRAEWTGFAAMPARSSNSKYSMFRPLTDIISNIFNQVPDCQLSYVPEPFVSPASECGSTTRPDANIIYGRTATDGTHWFNIVIPFEFKKARNFIAKHNNEQKIIWNLHEIMRLDPLRRFSLGITIESTDMRIWCGNRSLLMVSEPIDFTTEIDHIISLFYLIGKKSREELGWDPTIERINVDKKIQYKFKVGSQFFTTTRPLAMLGADAMIGRGTRVYEARDEHGKTVVIKDSWRDEDCEPEGAILKKISKDIRDELGEKEAADAQKYLVGIRVYEDIAVSGRPDRTFNPTEEGEDCSEWIDIDIDPILSRIRYSPGIGYIPRAPYSSEFMQDGIRSSRVHARTVFNELGLPLEDETRLTECFVSLSGAQRALYYIHKSGWVHRDVSVGNIFRVKEDGEWIGKLSDFEFAKKVTPEASPDTRMGTMHFLAAEVESQRYIFPTQLAKAGRPPFHMNLLHDLESLWWCAMWILLYHTDAKFPTDKPSAQLRCFREAFPDAFGQLSRLHFFTLFQERREARKTLSATYRDGCTAVMDVAAILRKYYEEAEKTYPNVLLDDSLLKNVHQEVSDAHSKVMGNLNESGIHLEPVHRVLESKRASDDSSAAGQKKKARQA